jgi:hypothetical protein
VAAGSSSAASARHASGGRAIPAAVTWSTKSTMAAAIARSLARTVAHSAAQRSSPGGGGGAAAIAALVEAAARATRRSPSVSVSPGRATAAAIARANRRS